MNKKQEKKWKEFFRSMIPRTPWDWCIVIGNAIVVFMIFGGIAHFQYNAQYCEEVHMTLEQEIMLEEFILKPHELEEGKKPYHQFYLKYKDTGQLPMGVWLNCSWEIMRFFEEDKYVKWIGIKRVE